MISGLICWRLQRDVSWGFGFVSYACLNCTTKLHSHLHLPTYISYICICESVKSEGIQQRKGIKRNINYEKKT